MKKTITLAMLLISSHLFASLHNGWHYRGTGQWQKKDGESGHYRLNVKGHYTKESLKIMQLYITNEKNWHFDYDVLNEKNGFFKIMKQDKKIGEGYCVYSHRKRAKNCHYNYNYQGMSIETSIHMKGKYLYRMGSVKGNGQWIRFKEKLFRHR